MRLTSIRSLLAACACAAFASCGEPPQAATPMSGFLGVDLPFPGERPSGELADPEPAAEAAPKEAAPEEPQIVHDKSPEISILCYHEFIEGESHIAERINIQKFRTQMQAINRVDERFNCRLRDILSLHFFANERFTAVVIDRHGQ